MVRRTHMCGELRSADAGRAVTLQGWVRAHRDHGRLVFLDLWDREGTTQVVADPRVSQTAYKVARELRDEDVVTVRGTVRERPSGTENPALATGRVEVAAEEIEVLNGARPLPFPVEDAPKVDEALRLRYRYLDLRRDALQGNLRLRHQVVKQMRDYLDSEGFLEVETPLLTRSTPEGARDYLVPSRVHPGEFYALPQSPQQMKQLLMVAGVDRYFQVARCFRDEDLRADRQPEFTQLDLEMSFVKQEDILSLVEQMVVAVVHAVQPGRPVETPFPRLTYDEAMARYGTDKPDLRFGLAFVDCTELLGASRVRIFRDAVAGEGVVRGFRVPNGAALTDAELESLQSLSQEFGAEGVIWFRVTSSGAEAPIANHLSHDERRCLVRSFDAVPGDLLLAIAGPLGVVNSALEGLRREMATRLHLVDSDRLSFAWVVDFPLLKWDAEGERWDAEHHPFTRPKPADLPLLDSDPGAVRAGCYDLVCNGWELGSGSMRIHERALQEQVLRLLGYTSEAAEASFGHLMEAFEHGAPPHGGLALGIDRLVAILAGTDTIRDVIAFPKTRQAADLMMRAPAPVSDLQMEEVHLRVATPRRSNVPAGAEC
ncbi:MAG: aspartate--tRNA ligase [Anaerolineae bacterium]